MTGNRLILFLRKIISPDGNILLFLTVYSRERKLAAKNRSRNACIRIYRIPREGCPGKGGVGGQENDDDHNEKFNTFEGDTGTGTLYRLGDHYGRVRSPRKGIC